MEKLIGVGKADNANYAFLIVSFSARSVLNATKSMEMKTGPKHKLANAIVKTYPSLLDCNNKPVIIIIDNRCHRYILKGQHPQHDHIECEECINILQNKNK